MKRTRKFLLRELPEEITAKKPVFMKTGFLAMGKDRDVIIRQQDKHFTLSVKNQGHSHSKKEYVIELCKKDFDTLWPSAIDNRVEYRCRTLVIDKRKVEINSFEGHLSGLITAKVIQDGRKKPSPFTPPTYFDEELTFDPRFKVRNLSSLDYGQIAEYVPLKNTGQYPQIGTIPYLWEGGKLQVMLITTRSNGTWIFPKGQPIPGKTSVEVALQESYEEAGIQGSITGHPIVIAYSNSTGTSSMILYPMAIEKICKNWPEEKERIRYQFPIKEATRKVKQQGLKDALGYLKFLEQ